MAQINLLKQPSVSQGQNIPKILAGFMFVVLLALGGYYAYLFYQGTKIDSLISAAKQQIGQDSQTAFSVPQREEILTRQLQLKNLNDLINKHVYWSQVFPKLAQSTLNRAAYTSLAMGNDGVITLSATVPSLQDLDIYLQVFDLPDVNKYFSNVKVVSFSKVQNKNSTSIQFSVSMNFNPAIIKYNSNPAASN